jgi:hypothetical protein
LPLRTVIIFEKEAAYELIIVDRDE